MCSHNSIQRTGGSPSPQPQFERQWRRAAAADAGRYSRRAPAHRTRLAVAGLVLALLAGCATSHPAARSEGIVVAMNLGMARLGDLERLHQALARSGIPCRVGILDLNYAPLLVDAGAASRAREAAAEIVIRDSLTIRLLKTPVAWESPSLATNSVYEVWDKGKLVREEGFKLY